MSGNVAKILSIALGPQSWLPVLFLIVPFRSGLSNQQLQILLPTIFVLQVALPLSYLYLAPKLGLATAWDLPKRKERYLFFAICLAGGVLSLAVVYFYGARFLFNLNLLSLTLLLTISLISLYWKISLHTSLNTFGAILINFLFGWQLPLLYLTIPVIFWARYKLHRHTFYQLLAGIVLSGSFMFIGLKILNRFG